MKMKQKKLEAESDDHEAVCGVCGMVKQCVNGFALRVNICVDVCEFLLLEMK